MAFGGGGDTAALKEAAHKEELEASRLAARNEARLRNLRARRSGRRALLAFASTAQGSGISPGGLQTTLG